MKIIFDVKHLYYLPQYLPVYEELKSNNIETSFLFHRDPDEQTNNICKTVIDTLKLPANWVNQWSDAISYYRKTKATWIVVGNAIDNEKMLHEVSKTALMLHGIGPKACYYDSSNNQTSVRFVEGQHRLKRLSKLFPEGNFIDTGYAKLDPAFNQSKPPYKLQQLGLDPNKKTILYAPTFYPSSIELFPRDFPAELSDHNLIIKPHFFSLTKNRYRKQKQLIESWQQHTNVYVAPLVEYNLLPFMQIADILISEASSAMFEFAALGKPVIWADFYKLRWSYRGVLSFRFTQRIDSDIQYFNQVAYRAKKYPQIKQLLEELVNGNDYKSKERNEIIPELAGTIDGKCSKRIVDYFINNP